MRYYVDEDVNTFLEENVEAVIELIKKAHEVTRIFYKQKRYDNFLYFPSLYTFEHKYCFYFARILKSIYKNSQFISADINYAHFSHILVRIGNNIYDIKGKRELEHYVVITNDILKLINENHNKVDDEIYAKFKNTFFECLDKYISYNYEFIKK